MSMTLAPTPLGLSLSKATFLSCGAGMEGKGFDKLSPNGLGALEGDG